MNAAAERLYERARALPPEQRATFLHGACPADHRLREELLSLLEQAEPAEGFFELLSRANSAPFATGGDQEDDADPIVGRTIGHYCILAHLGSGGMGTVYRAHDTRLDRDVALKFLPAHRSDVFDAEARFLVEARAVAALEHPNVCVVHDIGETEDGRPFIAMALCEGETLRERLRRGPMRPEDAVFTASQIARGLAAVHARGIVHRDVKPANVMLSATGTVKLLDFGLAQVADVTITEPGTPGTVAYMSPEQLRGDNVDLRTDLWSLGVVLYEMLTGTRPFRGGNDRALVQAILHADPEPALPVSRPEASDALTRIVGRLLRKDRSARYEGAGELLVDLASALAPTSAPIPRNEPQRVAALLSYGILDTSPESTYDELTELAARICEMPVAYVKFLDESRAWFKSKVGFPPELTQVPREASLCSTTICQSDLIVVRDCAADDRFRDNPTVTGWPNIRFYCGMPLVDGAGYALGTFCVLDYEPREMSLEHQELIRTLAHQVVTHLELRRVSTGLRRSLADVERLSLELERRRSLCMCSLDASTSSAASPSSPGRSGSGATPEQP